MSSAAATSSTTNPKTSLTKADPSQQLGSSAHFPWKLHHLLSACEAEGLSHVVSWLPSGDSFRVHDKIRFAQDVMPRYFNSTKYRSFQRNLSLWGFQTTVKGPSRGIVYHKHFLRGDPNQCFKIRRQRMAGGHPHNGGHEGESPAPSPKQFTKAFRVSASKDTSSTASKSTKDDGSKSASGIDKSAQHRQSKTKDLLSSVAAVAAASGVSGINQDGLDSATKPLRSPFLSNYLASNAAVVPQQQLQQQQQGLLSNIGLLQTMAAQQEEQANSEFRNLLLQSVLSHSLLSPAASQAAPSALSLFLQQQQQQQQQQALLLQQQQQSPSNSLLLALGMGALSSRQPDAAMLALLRQRQQQEQHQK